MDFTGRNLLHWCYLLLRVSTFNYSSRLVDPRRNILKTMVHYDHRRRLAWEAPSELLFTCLTFYHFFIERVAASAAAASSSTTTDHQTLDENKGKLIGFKHTLLVVLFLVAATVQVTHRLRILNEYRLDEMGKIDRAEWHKSQACQIESMKSPSDDQKFECHEAKKASLRSQVNFEVSRGRIKSSIGMSLMEFVYYLSYAFVSFMFWNFYQTPASATTTTTAAAADGTALVPMIGLNTIA